MFKLPGSKTSIRLFDRVLTTDTQYDVFDIGFQYDDGGIDSVAVGGSFYTAKKAAANLDRNAEKRAAKKARKAERKAAKATQAEA
jgi:hypothetical protein